MPAYQITAVGIFQYILVLNPMMSNTENGQEFGPFNTLQELKDYYQRELVEPYTDEGPNTFDGGTKKYRKTFRKGGPLEWMNPVHEFIPVFSQPDINSPEWGKPGHFGHGVHEVLTGVRDVVKQFEMPGYHY